MARIQGVPQSQAGPIVKLVYRFMRKGMKKMTGIEAAHGSGIEPVEIWAHQPKMMSGMGKFQQAVRKGDSVDERLKYLVELKGAQMIGCEYCVDLGSQICRNSGFSDEELLAIPRYRDSDLFTEREKLVEITALLTAVNLNRLNAAFGIGSAGFSEGMVCVPPDRPREEALQREPLARSTRVAR
jgi:AhpD family alkylhydroperoxidase